MHESYVHEERDIAAANVCEMPLWKIPMEKAA